MTIYLTGSNGFIGTSLRNYFGQDCIRMWKRNDEFNFIGVSAVINLAGKSQDLKKTDNPVEYYLVNTETSKRNFFYASENTAFYDLGEIPIINNSVDLVLNDIPNLETIIENIKRESTKPKKTK